MKQNTVSVKTRKENLLRTSMKNFQDIYNESEFRMRSNSSLHNLAGRLYSTTYNKEFKKFSSPQKTEKRPSSANKNNPQSVKALKGLQMRASHMGTYAELNTKLLEEKKQLENLIANLNAKIVQQKKKLNTADYNFKKNTNERDKAMQSYNQAHQRSLRLQENIQQTKSDNFNLTMQRNELHKKINHTQFNIEKQKNNCRRLDQNVKKLKHHLLQEEKLRNGAKNDLARQLKVMSSGSIYTKELENQRANVLIEINKFVKESQIQVEK